ncbi:MAG: hypothetical protein U9Q83_03205 [Bacteroidota bacterium]|nr:hypothetical protein [Bacteroidota bacterium]
MKFFKYLIIILFTLAFFSCKEDTIIEPTWDEKIETYRDMFDVFNKEYLLKGKVLINDSNNVSYIFDIYILFL